MTGLSGPSRKACARRGCERFPTQLVHIHEGIVPTIVGVCLMHEPELLVALDTCRAGGCSVRAVRFGLCDSHQQPMSANFKRPQAPVLAKEEEVRDIRQEEERTDKSVLELIEERDAVRLSDVTTELEIGVSKALASLNRLKDKGLVYQAGTPKTPSARWVRQGFAMTPSSEPPARIIDSKPSSRKKPSARPAPAQRVSVRRSRASRPDSPVVSAEIKNLANSIYESLGKIPGDVAVVLCSRVEACYDASGTGEKPPWRART